MALDAQTDLRSSQPSAAPADSSLRMERFVYNDGIVRAFLLVTVLWGVVAFLVGLVVACNWPCPS